MDIGAHNRALFYHRVSGFVSLIDFAVTNVELADDIGVAAVLDVAVGANVGVDCDAAEVGDHQ